MKTRTILLGVALLAVVLVCSGLKGYYDKKEEIEHQKVVDSMKEIPEDNKEGFATLGAESAVLLSGDYPQKQDPGYQHGASYSVLWHEGADSTKGLGSYEQTTNNRKYWKNPSDGTCSPPGLCNGLYGEKQLEEHKPPCQPPRLKPSKAVRVNYYNYFLQNGRVG